MRAKDIMTRPAHVIRQDASVESAAELMTGKRITALPVVDGDGLLVGMVSESDVLWHRVPADPILHARTYPDTDPAHRPGMVAEVMSAYPLTATPDTDVAEVAEAMLENDVRSLPVLDGRVVVGIISRRDILRAIIRGDDELVRDIQHRLDEYAGAGHGWIATVEGGVATVAGEYRNDTERAVVTVLARTVPGVSAVRLTAPAVS
jgi:CBS domain-containing protein